MASRIEGQGTATHDKSEKEIRHANDEWVEALVQCDTVTLDRIMADDFVFSSPFDGDDKAQFITGVAAGEIKVESLQRKDVIARVFGDTAVVTGSETAIWEYRERNITGHYRFLRVFAKLHGRWQMVSLQLCPVHQ
jgi:ketosteroid isomerase-like protein